MKKLICAILCIVMLLGLAVPALAVTVITNVEVYFTNDSNFNVGGTVTVDEYKIMDDGDIEADAWNALLEGRVQYYWMRNNTYYADGKSLTLTEADRGYTFYCEAALYSDMDRTQQFAVIFSDEFDVPEATSQATIPEITTASIPDGTVGQNYYCKLECTDADVVFGLYQSSLPEGMYITQHGEIEGVPTEAGFFHINVMATPEAGEDYAAMASYEFTIAEAATEVPTEETTETTTEATEQATEPGTEEIKPTEETAPKVDSALTTGAAPSGSVENPDGISIGLVIGLVAGAVVLTAVIMFIIFKATGKKKEQ